MNYGLSVRSVVSVQNNTTFISPKLDGEAVHMEYNTATYVLQLDECGNRFCTVTSTRATYPRAATIMKFSYARADAVFSSKRSVVTKLSTSKQPNRV